jgi:hypothetical protein
MLMRLNVDAVRVLNYTVWNEQREHECDSTQREQSSAGSQNGDSSVKRMGTVLFESRCSRVLFYGREDHEDLCSSIGSDLVAIIYQECGYYTD